jgi:hypothetical protein
MKLNKEILDENLSYYNVEGLVQEGSRLWMAIISAMNAVRSEYELNDLTPEVKCDRCGCHPGIIYKTEKGTFCQPCWEASVKP